MLNVLQQYFAHNLTRQGLQLSIAQPSSKMDSRRRVSMSTSKEIKLNKMTINKNIRDAIKEDIKKQKGN